MPWNVLLLPLIGGYFALHFFYYTRFRASRQEGHRLLLDSALVGLALIPPAHFLLRLIKLTGPGQDLRELWVGEVGAVPYAGTGVLALILGLVVPVGLNLLAVLLLLATGVQEVSPPPSPRDFRPNDAESKHVLPARVTYRARGYARWISACAGWLMQPARNHAEDWAMQGDHLHRILRRAITTDRPVMVTLKDRKVYVGLIWELPQAREPRGFMSLLPVFSGYRDPVDLRFTFMTLYPKYQELEGDLAAEDFLVAVPWDQILGAHLFDQRAYDRYFKHQGEALDSLGCSLGTHAPPPVGGRRGSSGAQ